MKITVIASAEGDLSKKGISIRSLKLAGPDFTNISFIEHINNTGDGLIIGS